MKYLFILILLIITYADSNSQTSEEWLNQKEKQKEYLLRQILYLKMYAGYVQQGIDVVQQGLTTINRIKKGDFDLHNDFLNSHKSINPNISRYTKVADIIRHQVAIVTLYKKAIKQLKAKGEFTGEEISYVSKVLSNLLEGCSDNLSNLAAITTSKNLELSDDERMRRVDLLYADMKEKYSFEQHFTNDLNLLSHQRQREHKNIKNTRALYGLKP